MAASGGSLWSRDATMPQRFVPKYDIKIRGGEHIIEWRYGAHPTVHAVSPSGVPLILRPKSQVTPNASDGVRQLTTDPGGGGGGSGARNKHSVLPPIKESGRNKNHDFSLSELDDISLKNEVIRRVKEISERNLQGLLANLRTQDRDRDGILSTDIVKGTLKRYQLHLSDDGLKNLCKKFGQAGDVVTMVRYEEMFSYLTKSRMEALRAPPPPQQRPAGNPVHEQQQQQQQQARRVNMRNRIMFGHQDETKLIEDLQRQLEGKPVNMADLRRTMYGLDRDRNDFLSGQQVEVALSKCGFHLTPDVRARLLLATDRTGAGIYKIDTLMNYITRVKPETNNMAYLGNNHYPRQPREVQLPINQNQQAPPATTEFLPDEGFSEDEQQQQQQQQQQRHQQQTTSTMYAPPPPAAALEPEVELGFDVQKWSSDYQYLAQALYNSDQDQSGYNPVAEVQHVTSTYNLVYNLSISDHTLDSALSAATDPNYGEVNLEYFITTLQDLHFRENGAY